ncbi:ABC transporter related [Beutenbergia cavernae DSM 12333]|uniref:ABC transporter related n=1 Tax=Beutenbergia cavernae (strain ATCC BAA-8 / DSM 12333 / CCUG 43141 / JCM 11478 / NBRC 16432 / NCIMB 13614 / HKI 0122) TaxID=471853 RepID=C5C4S2_BEUC1|nr:ABC transporter ATP-binding protein [Beutenbergia cavernae]ACQ80050.1 ABC transporter related [Beutenbergia cavernae DSM 12333]
MTVLEDAPVLDVAGLTVSFGRRHHARTVVADVDLHVRRGEALALVGESGSGKSVTARALIGLAGDRSTVRAARIGVAGVDVFSVPRRGWRRLRGSRVGFVLQDALVSLDPLRPVGREIEEVLRLHTAIPARQRHERVIELLTRVGVDEPGLRAAQRPDQLSGGLRQRALIATALAAQPELIVLDEPTTALDVTVQARILDVLRDLKDAGTTLLFISHDLAVVSQIADRVAVMRQGRIVEEASTADLLHSPGHDYTRLLLSAVPRLALDARTAAPPVGTAEPDVVAEVRAVSKSFAVEGRRTFRAVDDVSFQLHRGRTLGLVGESGSGKTTLARLLVGLEAPDTGAVAVDGQTWRDLDAPARRRLRRRIGVIHQDPTSSFDPRYTVDRVLGEVIALDAATARGDRRRRAVELLELVGLPEDVLPRRPAVLSGGQRQRVAIARALAARPSVVVCDEPVSALDVSTQAQVLELLADLQLRTGTAYLFISHDLGVVHEVSHDVLVLKDGRVVESGPAGDVLHRPTHPYTRALFAAVPRLPEVATPTLSTEPIRT